MLSTASSVEYFGKVLAVIMKGKDFRTSKMASFKQEQEMISPLEGRSIMVSFASYLIDYQIQMKVIKMPFIIIKTAFVKDQRKKRQRNYYLFQRLFWSVRNQLIAPRIGMLMEAMKLINFLIIVIKAASAKVGVELKKHRILKGFTATAIREKMMV